VRVGGRPRFVIDVFFVLTNIAKALHCLHGMADVAGAHLPQPNEWKTKAQIEGISTAIASLPTGEFENDPQNTTLKLTRIATPAKLSPQSVYVKRPGRPDDDSIMGHIRR
jgi:hypothetical protein